MVTTSELTWYTTSQRTRNVPAEAVGVDLGAEHVLVAAYAEARIDAGNFPVDDVVARGDVARRIAAQNRDVTLLEPRHAGRMQPRKRFHVPRAQGRAPRPAAGALPCAPLCGGPGGP